MDTVISHLAIIQPKTYQIEWLSFLFFFYSLLYNIIDTNVAVNNHDSSRIRDTIIAPSGVLFLFFCNTLYMYLFFLDVFCEQKKKKKKRERYKRPRMLVDIYVLCIKFKYILTY